MRRLRLVAAVGVSAVGVAVFIPSLVGRATGGATATFTTFEVSGQPGTVCPQATPPATNPCTDFAAEPQIRAARDGTFFGSSENGLGGGTVAFRSTDNGLRYRTLLSPNAAGTPIGQFGVGGGDTDLAVAPVKNPAGRYNLYVASLSLADVDVSTSTDGGNTFFLNPTAATIPLDDREWIAADGAAKVCISYHDIATFNIDVNCSYNAGLAFTQLSDAFDPAHLYLLENNAIGNLTIDAGSHTIYQTFSGIAQGDNAAICGVLGCGNHVVYMAVSKDGGLTFTDHTVFANPNPNVSYGHQFVNVSVDAAGNVYSFFSDNRDLFYSFSTDQGTTWSPPARVNRPPSNTAIMPWSVAGDAGRVDVVWYGTDFKAPGTPPDAYPPSAAWYVYFAQNLSATTSPSFSQQRATPIIHFGGVCEGGISCTGNRDLFDDFGVAASPTTGLASIDYSDDQYVNTAAEPPSPGCTPANSNSGICDHTDIATQTSGTPIFGGGGGSTSSSSSSSSTGTSSSGSTSTSTSSSTSTSGSGSSSSTTTATSSSCTRTHDQGNNANNDKEQGVAGGGGDDKCKTSPGHMTSRAVAARVFDVGTGIDIGGIAGVGLIVGGVVVLARRRRRV